MLALMSRLQAQWRRLYALPSPQGDHTQGPDLVGPQGQVRALVLQLARPADWPAMAHLWQGVQDDLNLPAPAIAVNGVDGYQLWFSVSQAITADQAHGFLTLLCHRYWAEVPAERVSLMPLAQGGTPPTWRHAAPVPAPARMAGQWSAFVARDLAPVFNDSPWLDIPPNPEGQADLLLRLRSIEHDELVALLGASAPAHAASAGSHTSPDPLVPQAPPQDAHQFLLRVMNDPTVELALRIEAAKALLLQPPA